MQTQVPQILDVTVRDGSYLINHNFPPDRVAEIAKGLASAGIEYAEISHGAGIGGRMMGFPGLVDDEQLLEAARLAAPSLKFSIFISPFDLALPILPGLLDFFEIGRVGVSVNQVSSAEKHLQKLKKYHKTASLQLTRCHALPPEEAAKGAKRGEELGADIIYVVDTFGSMLPHEVRTYIQAVKSETKKPVGFHGHNTMGLAIPNALAALEEGVDWIDASLRGVGRSAGNANLEQLTLVMQERGLHPEIKLDLLQRVSEQVVSPLFPRSISNNYIELLLALEKLDFSPVSFLDLCAHAAGVSIEDLLMQAHNKMKDSLILHEGHIKEALDDYGVDFQKLLEVLKH